MIPRYSFKAPPLVEVVMGAVHAPANIKTGHLGAFWSRVKGSYPQLEDAPPIIDSPEGGGIFEIFPMSRLWLKAADGASLLQLQRDRLLYNWKRSSDDSYPRFEQVYNSFSSALVMYRDFLDQEGVELPPLREFELSYINHIPFSESQSVSFFNKHCLPEPDQDGLVAQAWGWHEIYLLPDEMGRLTISAAQVRAQTGEALIKFDLSAKGFAEDMQAWFNNAHEILISAFVRATNDKVQTESWGRFDG